MISNSHVSGSGDTVDNLETGALSADNLFTVVKSLRLQKAQDGDLGSYHADGLLVPVNLHRTAVEIADSELKTNTANNNLNYFSRVYPGLVVGSSEYLDSAYNSLNSNADTSYFVVSKLHSITRAVRVGIEREYVDAKYDRKRRAFYRARFSERVYAGTWGGLVGSNGTV
jgi:ribosomal protein S17